MQGIDTSFTVDTLKLGAKRWIPTLPQPDKRMLCYHGWLDNAGTFDELGSVMCREGWDVVALDAPGCGYSDWLPAHSNYNDFEESVMMVKVADMLGWDRLVFVGHSRGGGVALLAAAAFPERAAALVQLDSYPYIWPYETGLRFVDRVRKFKKDTEMNMKRAAKAFPSFENAVERNMNNVFHQKAKQTAENIVRRHLKQVQSGEWVYSHDPRWYDERQVIGMSQQQLVDIASSLECPILRVMGPRYHVTYYMSKKGPQPPESIWKEFYKNEHEYLSSFKNLETIVLEEGGHHVHSDLPELVFDAMRPFLLSVLPIRQSPAPAGEPKIMPASKL